MSMRELGTEISFRFWANHFARSVCAVWLGFLVSVSHGMCEGTIDFGSKSKILVATPSTPMSVINCRVVKYWQMMNFSIWQILAWEISRLADMPFAIGPIVSRILSAVSLERLNFNCARLPRSFNPSVLP